MESPRVRPIGKSGAALRESSSNQEIHPVSSCESRTCRARSLKTQASKRRSRSVIVMRVFYPRTAGQIQPFKIAVKKPELMLTDTHTFARMTSSGPNISFRTKGNSEY